MLLCYDPCRFELNDLILPSKEVPYFRADEFDVIAGERSIGVHGKDDGAGDKGARMQARANPSDDWEFGSRCRVV